MLLVTFSGLVLILFSCKKSIYDKNLDCSTSVSFSQQILPLVENNCTACHSAGEAGYTLTDHANISNHAEDMLSSMKGINKLMPEDGPLDITLIQKFECWIKQGKPNN
jgi:hypothetical protein